MGRSSLVLKLILTAALIVWLFRQVDLAAIGAAVAHLSVPTIGAACALVLLQQVVLGWRWHRIVGWLGGDLPLPIALRWVFVGLFFNQALPTGVGGDAIRMWALNRRGQPGAVAIGSVVVERGTGLFVLCMVVTLAVLSGPSQLRDSVLGGALLVLSSLLVVTLVLIGWADRWLTRWLPNRLAKPCKSLAMAMRSMLRSRRAVVEVLAGGLVASSAGLLAAVVLGGALGLQQEVHVYFAVVGATVLITLLPISLGGWGLREASMVALFGQLGSPAEPVVALSVLWGLLPLGVALPGGLMFWFFGSTIAADSESATPASIDQHDGVAK